MMTRSAGGVLARSATQVLASTVDVSSLSLFNVLRNTTGWPFRVECRSHTLFDRDKRLSNVDWEVCPLEDPNIQPTVISRRGVIEEGRGSSRQELPRPDVRPK